MTINKNNYLNAEIYTVPNNRIDEVVKKLYQDDVITMTGRVVRTPKGKESDTRYSWVEVTHEGVTGSLSCYSHIWE